MEIAPVASDAFVGAAPGGLWLPWFAVVQLAFAVVAQGNKARAIRRGGNSPVGVPERLSVLAYGLIALFCVLGLSRGSRSGLLIAGYDDLLAAILTSSALSLLLHAIDLRGTSNVEQRQEPHARAAIPKNRVARWFEAVTATVFAIACMLVEVTA